MFVYVMEALRTPNGDITPVLLLAIGLLIVAVVAITRMKEPGESAAGTENLRPAESAK